MGTARTFTAARRHGSWPLASVTVALGAIYVVSTVLTPLYPTYEQRFRFDELVVAEIYASYVIGNLGVLFFFGRLSDQIGRRSTTLTALAIAAVGALLFLFAQSAAWLFAGRALTGFSSGLGAGALTAWTAELEPHRDRARAARIASAGNLGGLAIGALYTGLLAANVRPLLRVPYVVYIALLAIVTALIARTPETVQRRARSFAEISLRPRIGVPRELRVPFVAPACMAFASFALGGFYAALVPGLLTARLHLSSAAVIGGVVALFFGSAAAIGALSPTTTSRRALVLAVVFLFVTLALLIGAEAARSLFLLLVASVASGASLAFGFRGSLQAVNEMAPEGRRAELVSAYLLVCYTANALPTIGVGWLARVVPAQIAHIVFAGVLAVLGVVSLVVTRRRAEAGPRSGTRRIARGR